MIVAKPNREYEIVRRVTYMYLQLATTIDALTPLNGSCCVCRAPSIPFVHTQPGSRANKGSASPRSRSILNKNVGNYFQFCWPAHAARWRDAPRIQQAWCCAGDMALLLDGMATRQ